ncbi:MAG: hypothetical protein BWY28_03238 [bacterium ADurb.Bin236]|nr:MAG: hypothetical protein BWY28_03238 [bacterium ADurb.Bin236]
MRAVAAARASASSPFAPWAFPQIAAATAATSPASQSIRHSGADFCARNMVSMICRPGAT